IKVEEISDEVAEAGRFEAAKIEAEGREVEEASDEVVEAAKIGSEEAEVAEAGEIGVEGVVDRSEDLEKVYNSQSAIPGTHKVGAQFKDEVVEAAGTETEGVEVAETTEAAVELSKIETEEVEVEAEEVEVAEVSDEMAEAAKIKVEEVWVEEAGDFEGNIIVLEVVMQEVNNEVIGILEIETEEVEVEETTDYEEGVAISEVLVEKVTEKVDETSKRGFEEIEVREITDSGGSDAVQDVLMQDVLIQDVLIQDVTDNEAEVSEIKTEGIEVGEVGGLENSKIDKGIRYDIGGDESDLPSAIYNTQSPAIALSKGEDSLGMEVKETEGRDESEEKGLSRGENSLGMEARETEGGDESHPLLESGDILKDIASKIFKLKQGLSQATARVEETYLTSLEARKNEFISDLEKEIGRIVNLGSELAEKMEAERDYYKEKIMKSQGKGREDSKGTYDLTGDISALSEKIGNIGKIVEKLQNKAQKVLSKTEEMTKKVLGASYLEGETVSINRQVIDNQSEIREAVSNLREAIESIQTEGLKVEDLSARAARIENLIQEGERVISEAISRFKGFLAEELDLTEVDISSQTVVKTEKGWNPDPQWLAEKAKTLNALVGRDDTVIYEALRDILSEASDKLAEGEEYSSDIRGLDHGKKIEISGETVEKKHQSQEESDSEKEEKCSSDISESGKGDRPKLSEQDKKVETENESDSSFGQDKEQERDEREQDQPQRRQYYQTFPRIKRWRSTSQPEEVGASGASLKEIDILTALAPAAGGDKGESNLRQSFLYELVKKVRLLIQEGRAEMLIRIRPEHLGPLMVRVGRDRGGKIWVRFITPSSRVGAMVESNLSLLKEAMEESGLELDSLDVWVREGSEGEERKGQEVYSGKDKSSRKKRSGLNEIPADEVVTEELDEEIRSRPFSWLAENVNYMA
ncbi:MAG: flagellar hook-length control protein FliK, partial [bacterium]